MDTNNYRSVTPLKRKRKKITAPAALILCAICLIVGILCGKAFSSTNKKLEDAQKEIAILQEENARIDKLEATYQKEINNLNAEIAQMKKDISDREAVAAQTEDETPAEPEEEAPVASAEVDEPAVKKASGGFLRTLIIIILVAIILVCIIFGASLFLKKSDDEDDDEDYDEDDYEEFEDYEDEDEETESDDEE